MAILYCISCLTNVILQQNLLLSKYADVRYSVIQTTTKYRKTHILKQTQTKQQLNKISYSQSRASLNLVTIYESNGRFDAFVFILYALAMYCNILLKGL